MDKVWKLGDFSSHIGVHYNTIDRWFKMLEEQHIHYVNRVLGEKIYDTLDLEIAKFIESKRKEKWALAGIFYTLSENFELRTFPINYSHENKPLSNSMEHMKNFFVSEMKQNFKQFQCLLPNPEKERMERVNEILNHRKIEYKLRKEAIEHWEKKPKNERKIRVGLFKKQEDINAREKFMLEYIEQYYANEVKNLYNIID